MRLVEIKENIGVNLEQVEKFIKDNKIILVTGLYAITEVTKCAINNGYGIHMDFKNLILKIIPISA